MIKIYINETPLILATPAEAQAFQPSKTMLVSRYVGNPKYLHHFIDNLEKSHKLEAIVAFHPNFERLKNDFFSIYKVKEAAGGVVQNDANEVLMIQRHGFWDMAKGHIENGETAEIAAIREVKEETNIQNIELKKLLHTTYHTFRNKKKERVLKISHWYSMTSNDTAFQPQTEEGIEQVQWHALEKAKQLTPIYKNILDLLEMI